MKRVVLIVFFTGLAGLFVWLWFNSPALSLSHEARQNVRTIVPSMTNSPQTTTAQSVETAAYDEPRAQPMIAIGADETFLQAISTDINKDGSADQICAVKKISESNIYLVPAVQNPATGEYTRLPEIRTGVTQVRTLLFYILDIIGDRSNALIYSGMTQDNIQTLAVCLPTTDKDGKTVYSTVADLRADGPINIQEVPRSDAYNLGLTGGESYPIYLYTSNPDSPQTLDQIEHIYRWDKNLKRYEQVSESRIEGKKIESRLVRQLQGGNVDSFEEFLTGVWYMNSTSAQGTTKYIYFNPEEKEIIFHNGATEEIYTRQSGVPRHYGAFLIAQNQSIASIRRMIDIELTGIDEISIKVQEDVKLKIGVTSEWDGLYKKMSNTPSAIRNETDQLVDTLKKTLENAPEGWAGTDGSRLGLAGGKYTFGTSSETESGQYTFLAVKDSPVLQLKPAGKGTKSRFYLAKVDNPAKINLTEVTVTTNGTNLAGPPPVTFLRKMTSQ
jgi:hypothetical protein